MLNILFLFLLKTLSQSWGEDVPIYSTEADCTMYRLIRVTNQLEEELYDVEAMVQIITKDMLVKGNCNEFLFLYKEGDREPTKFWVENDCSIENSVVNLWFKVEKKDDVVSLYALESVHYVLYHGCQQVSEQSRNPVYDLNVEFVKLSKTDCEAPFHHFEESVDKLLVIDSEYHVNSGEMEHDHIIPAGTSLESKLPTIQECTCSPPESFTNPEHTHTWDQFVSDRETNIPSHYSVFFCKSEYLDYHVGDNDLYLFEGSVPQGLSLLADSSAERYILGGESYYVSTLGEALHSHTFSVELNPSSAKHEREKDVNKVVSHGDHVHMVHGSSNEVKLRPPYYSLTLAEKILGSVQIDSSFYLLSTGVPEIGFDVVSHLDGKFVSVEMTAGETGGSYQHGHTFTDVVSERTYNFAIKNGEFSYSTLEMEHLHEISGTLENAIIDFPSISLVLLRKKTMDIFIEQSVDMNFVEKYWCKFIKFDQENVCSGHGHCIEEDTCECFNDQTGYYESSGDGDCVKVTDPDLDVVCTIDCGVNSICLDNSICVCKQGYIGNPPSVACQSNNDDSDDADDTSDSDDFDDSDRGDERDEDDTDTDDSDKTDDGDDDENGRPTLVNNVGLFLGITLPLGLFTSLVCACAIFMAMVIIYLMRNYISSSSNMKKMREAIPEMDILLEEHEMEEKNTNRVAKLEIDQKFFAVEMDSISFKEKLGSGTSGSVYKATWKGIDVAFKIFTFAGDQEEKLTTFENEIRIISSVNHPHIVEFYGATLSPPKIGFLTRFCEKGNLKEFLKNYNKKKKAFYPYQEKLRVLKEIALAMTHLHSLGIVHRDLKLENVVIDKNEIAKLTDFGLSKVDAKTAAEKTMRVAEIAINNDQDYNEKVDVFSFSIMMFMVFGNCFEPYGPVSFGMEIKVAREGLRPPLKYMSSAKIPKRIVNIIIRCWDRDPQVRYSFEELSKMIK